MERLEGLANRVAFGIEHQSLVGREERVKSLAGFFKKTQHTVRIVCGSGKVEEHLDALVLAGVAERLENGEIKITRDGIRVEILAG